GSGYQVCDCSLLTSEFIQVAKNYEDVRKKWLQAEVELKKLKELLVKSDVAKASLEVKLKHARNQVDVEMKKRYKAEADYQYLERQMQLMCDILVHDSKSSACLNDEQRSVLASFNHRGANLPQQKIKRLSVIDESSFLFHSDVSYDRSDDDLDLDSTVIKPLKSRAREKRVNNLLSYLNILGLELTGGYSSLLYHVSLHFFDFVIRPETCMPCRKRIRFGKLALKCRDCRLVAHPECSSLCPSDCSPSFPGPVHKFSEDTLESFAPLMQPRIPHIIVQCVNEIEKRGLEERGIYRVPGGERAVKELRDKYILGKGPLTLGKVEEIHAICGLLKDFLRKLREPLVTFRLHRAFMDACEIEDEDASSALMFEAIGNLPQANRDTLAFLMLHLQKVMQSPQCQMDRNNLARVFGPTIVGHGMPEPSPLTIMKDTNAQPKVGYLLSVLLTIDNSNSYRLFKPLTSPELNKCLKTPASGMLKGKIRNLGTAFNSM
uniref:Si:ch1073-416j23.1 n=1 Tax=Scleropages formosus TaxID=113540 RepID=A0A8C9SSR5_SCLFO